MKRIDELRKKRTEKVEELEKMNSILEKENRTKTDEEKEQFNSYVAEIEEIDREIEDLEKEEELKNKEVRQNLSKKIEFKEKRNMEKYNLQKAISEFTSSRSLSGIENEANEKGKAEFRAAGHNVKTNAIYLPSSYFRAYTAQGNSGHISELAGHYDVVADRLIMNQLGVTVYDGLNSNIKLVYSDGFNARFLDEGQAVTGATAQETTDKLEARRVQGSTSYSHEFLAQSSTVDQMVMDMMLSLDSAIAKELFDEILDGTALAGATGVTYQNVMKLKGAVKSSQFVNPGFVADGELFSKLESTTKDGGSGRFIIEDNKINGYRAIDAQGLIAAGNLIFGDWRRASVGLFGGVEILVDPYSLSDEGKVKITYSRLADVSANKKAFKSLQGLSVA